ncbi:HEPN domain-containing protein [Photobacterium minamisatsumaniensis]|uniref:HEPN domain-containing protein n=1 Tax=Photobacterium minamisatsumaniensis TaxID=2910233 RepID=UPI003D1375AD
MSVSSENFKIAMKEAGEILDCYDEINKNSNKQSPTPEALKRATLILILTAWETYIEDVAEEIFKNKFGVLLGSHAGGFVEKQFKQELNQLHNPNSQKVRKLFFDFLGVDITASWNWANYNSEQAKTVLNRWLKRRGEAVHRARTDSSCAHVVKRDELNKCIRFFNELVDVTDRTLFESSM